MEATVPAFPSSVDPLIAEARRRARRRQMLLVAAVVTVAVVAATLIGTLRPFASASVPARPASVLLHDAVARGRLVSLNRRTSVAVFRISCGWHVEHGRGKTRLRPGLYRMALRGGLFNVSDPFDEADEVGYSRFASFSARSGWPAGWPAGWQAWLELGNAGSKPYFSSGGSTDICNGVLP